MTWNVVTVAFGNEDFKIGQKFLEELSQKPEVNSISFGDDDLYGSDVYKENEKWFSEENNRGWFAWKPYFILKAMEGLEDGDMIMYLDTKDIFHPEIFQFVDDMIEDDFCLLPIGGPSNGEYTKRDCFVYMECDEEDYWDSPQLEAGFSFWKVSDKSKEVLSEWLKWCLDERVNGEDSSFSEQEELPNFKGCRHDQSILTNLAIRDGLGAVGQDIRAWIECNADFWYQRQERGTTRVLRPIDTYMMEIKNTVPYLPDPPEEEEE